MRNNRGTGVIGVVEYSVLIGLLVAGLITMQAYIKRSIQGNMRGSMTKLGDGGMAGYAPRSTTSNIVMNTHTEEGSSSVTDAQGNLTTTITNTTMDRIVDRVESVDPYAR